MSFSKAVNFYYLRTIFYLGSRCLLHEKTEGVRKNQEMFYYLMKLLYQSASLYYQLEKSKN